MQQVILAEKPSVAREIAKVLKINDKKDGYITNGTIAVTWAFGHLVQLAQPQDYENFAIPYRPDYFKLKINQVKNDKGDWVTDAGAEKQLSIIENLFSNCEEIIVATDAGREGELIFRYIYQVTGCKKPFRRLWVSSLTEKAIKEGFDNLQPGEKFDNLFYSAKCRSEADWLVGFNASIALSQALLRKIRVSLGRVQTPTLAMIIERYQQNKNFVSEPYYTVRITCSKLAQNFTADSDNFFNKETTEDIFEKIKKAKTANVITTEKKEKKEQPPLLLDLTTLQRKANQKFGLSAADTLSVAQSLYESGYITYPRTDSQYISNDIFETIPALLQALRKVEPLGKYADAITNLNSKSVNDSKVNDHHAILPTDKIANKLNDEQQLIYTEIIKNTIKAFSLPCIKDTISITLSCADTFFKASGSTIKVPGWRLMDIDMKDSEEDVDEEQQFFPELIQFENIDKIEEEILIKATKPKAIHTEATLLAAMETCGKDADDDSIREALKDSGIGTPATRANIIEKLIHIGYVQRERKSLIPTPKGISVYELVKNKPIASPEMTGLWEKKLNLISKGQESAKLFVDDIFSYSKVITKELLRTAPELLNNNLSENNNKKTFFCPKCGSGELRESEKNYYCTNYKNTNCDFVIWKNIASKKLSNSVIKELIEKGKTKLISGFISKTGKEFQAKLKLDKDLKLTFEFENIAKKQKS